MKLKINREVAIGLSVLQALLVILGGVAVRRIFNHEAIVALEEEKHGEEPRAEGAEHGLEWPRKSEIAATAANFDHDHAPGTGDWEHRNDAAKELKKETRAIVTELIHPEPPAVLKPQRREVERPKINSLPAPLPTDERYSAEAIPREKNREFPAANANSIVVRAGGDERADGMPRPADRKADEAHPHPGEQDYRDRGMGADSFGPVPAGARQVGPRDGLGAGMPVDPEAARKLERKQDAVERRMEERKIEEPRASEQRARNGRSRSDEAKSPALQNDEARSDRSTNRDVKTDRPP